MKKALAAVVLVICAFAVSAQIMYQTPSGDAYAMLTVTSSSLIITDSGGSYTFIYKGVSTKDSNTLIYTSNGIDVYISRDLSCFSMFAPNGESMFFTKSNSGSAYSPSPSYSAPAPVPEICYTCHGTGRCVVCHGTGVYSNYGYSSVCSACGGTGKCWHCHGTGKQ